LEAKTEAGFIKGEKNPEIALKPENKLKKSRRMDQKPLNLRFQSHPPRGSLEIHPMFARFAVASI